MAASAHRAFYVQVLRDTPRWFLDTTKLGGGSALVSML
jgi:hypothetical protein